VTARVVTGLLVAVLLVTGCASEELVGLRMPRCGDAGARTTFLMAQSVPSAALVPCIDSEVLPPDLFMESMQIDSTGTRLTFLGDWPRDAPLRLDVRFTAACDVGDAVTVTSDEPDVRRLDHVDITAGYVGERYYVFDEGCAVYRFDARGEGWSGFVGSASLALTFIPRAEVERLRNVALDR
jgi:hypothetical protein